jgi:hypothetical protein
VAEDVAADVVETNCFIMLKCFSLPTKYQEKGPWLPVVESLCETLGIYADSLGIQIDFHICSVFAMFQDVSQ